MVYWPTYVLLLLKLKMLGAGLMATECFHTVFVQESSSSLVLNISIFPSGKQTSNERTYKNGHKFYFHGN